SLMGLLDRYRQFRELSPEEVSAGLRAEADERRRQALERVGELDLSKTTWHEYPPSPVVDAITFPARRGLHRYAGADGELRSALAHRHGVPVDRVVLGDGASQLLVSAAQVLLEPGDELLAPWPAYPLYPVMAREAGAQVVTVPGHSVDAILGALTKKTRLVVLANPNDPTGELIGAPELERLLEALPERVGLLLDEALRDFVDREEPDAALRLAGDHPRLLVFRSFSKAWGLAGLRCGYAVCGPGAEALLAGIGPALGIGELSQAGALKALDSISGVVAGRASQVAAERRRLYAELADRPVQALPDSQANFIWLAAEGMDGAQLASALARFSVTVATGSALGDSRHVRVTVQDEAAGDRFLRALDQALGLA
ncbi:MAG: pyridoxal phosphate-dependent aminotransferase, partial [Solirubrobacterales bacterium]